ncbi:type IX secretion system PorP/SprF family membrane protein [Mangrovibacterium marinum]|uniref:Type IX secretion system PorP/SprF family membrane protein n=2 Tax=Mangrovibacterium marinum TaxID=1639118 RepID=A0A2T5BYT2_9BACT|nr:type IX secretion system PorP/SprF family membrane protein [Mangrovibacterium marinum]
MRAYGLKRVFLQRMIPVVLCMCGVSSVFAQIDRDRSHKIYTDPVFTQYMNGMQTINPAYAGMWEKVGVQVFTRRYFMGQEGAPLMTAASWYKPVKNDNNGIGLNINNEHIGYENKLTIAADYSYQVRLDWKTDLRLGLKVGIINYDNLLTRYDLDWGTDEPDQAFATDVHQHLMLKWGVGALVYTREYYIGLSIPQIISNKFRSDIANFSSLADVRYCYLLGGYFFGRQRQIRFKPTLLVKGAVGEPIVADLAANWLFWDQFWVGAMYRTNNTAALLTQFVMMKNIRFGYAMEFPFGREIFKYQLQTHEIRVVYEFDFYRRPYTRKQYF